MLSRCLVAIIISLGFGFSANGVAQENCVTYKLVPKTVYKKQPMTVSRLVNETAFQTQQVTTYKPVWTTETRQRKTVSFKPVTKTSERIERYLVRRPIMETSFREREISETSFETVTEMREQRYLVEKPVIETRMREQKVVVRKPVTTTMLQTENVTSYKPVTVSEQQLVAGASVRDEVLLQTGRNRLRWLRPGVYVDPVSGRTGYRTRGLHWVPNQNLVLQSVVEPALIEQTVSRVAFEAETVQVQKPIQVTEFVDSVETRQFPVQVATTSKSIRVLKIPVTVQKPVTKIRTEKIPVSEVKYREEIYERRVPVTETSYQRVEQSEPYQVEVCKWVAENKQVQIPKTVSRRVNYSVDQLIAETEWVCVPVDVFGNIVGQPVSASPSTITGFRYSDRLSSIPVRETKLTPIAELAAKPKTFVGKPTFRKLSDAEFNELRRSLKPNSVLVPESNAGDPQTDIIDVKPRQGSTTRDNVDAALEDQEPADQIPTIESSSPNLQPETTLEIELNDGAEIDSRPERDNTDELKLTGKN